MFGGNSHQRAKERSAKARTRKQPPEPSNTTTMSPVHKSPDAPKERHFGDYLLGAGSILAEYFAVRYSASWLAWFAALLFWLAIYDYTKSKTSNFVRRVVPICAAIVLIPVTMMITGVGFSRPKLIAAKRPPAAPTQEAVATEPLNQEALLISSDIDNFLAGREATAPPLPTKENLESGLSQYGMYEQETLRIYKEIYRPRIKQIRDKLAKAGRTSEQLDAIYENPQSSDGIRLVAKTLLEFAKPSKNNDAVREKPLSERPIAPNTPCTMKEGTYYPSALKMPGGPKLNRPLFELEGGSKTVWYEEGDRYWFLMEFTLTNRGEASTVKDWELCLERDGKPVMFQPMSIPKGEITLVTGETITQSDMLMEVAAKEQIEHGHLMSGWVAFSIPQTIAETLKNNPKLPNGSVRFKDYLAHTYSYDFVGNDRPNPNVYVPGRN